MTEQTITSEFIQGSETGEHWLFTPDRSVAIRKGAFGSYEAWARDDSAQFPSYSTITYLGSIRYGQLGSEKLPDELEALPAYSEERKQAVGYWHAMIWERAHSWIFAAYPELLGSELRKFHGELTVIR